MRPASLRCHVPADRRQRMGESGARGGGGFSRGLRIRDRHRKVVAVEKIDEHVGDNRMIKARVVMKLDDETVDFDVSTAGHHVRDALERITKAMDHEFDHCFNAERWKTVSIEITRELGSELAHGRLSPCQAA
jgi:hypothetical protein